MTTEVRVMLQLTLDVDATLSKEEIIKQLTRMLTEDYYKDIDVQMVDIIEIREEAEIYGTEK